MKIPHLDHAALLAMLHYDPETGIFIWRTREDARPQWNARYAGKVAGYARTATGGRQYWSVRIYDWPFHAHRLAYFYMTGLWPLAEIDHIDNDGLNNRWANLRDATKSQNGANRGASRNNKAGLKGVSFCRKAGRYRATIRLNGKQKWLGYFDTAAAAHEAYKAAAIEKSGEFARFA